VERSSRLRLETAKGRRCGRARIARIIMIPASGKDESEREALSREIGHIIRKIRRSGGDVDPGLVRAKDAIDDRENHLLVARSRWGELLGALSYTFPDKASLRVDYIGFSVHRCGLGTRLMAAVARIALQGNRKILLTAQKGARGFFERLGMVVLDEYHDGNSALEFSPEGMQRFLEETRRAT
jgi:Acetyltransferase (GNAT) domain